MRKRTLALLIAAALLYAGCTNTAIDAEMNGPSAAKADGADDDALDRMQWRYQGAVTRLLRYATDEELDRSITEGGAGLNTLAVLAIMRLRDQLSERGSRIYDLEQLEGLTGVGKQEIRQLVTYAIRKGLIDNDLYDRRLMTLEREVEGTRVALDGGLVPYRGSMGFNAAGGEGVLFFALTQYGERSLVGYRDHPEEDPAKEIAEYTWSVLFPEYARGVTRITYTNDNQIQGVEDPITETHDLFPCGRVLDAPIKAYPAMEGDRYTIGANGGRVVDTCNGVVYEGDFDFEVSVELEPRHAGAGDGSGEPYTRGKLVYRSVDHVAGLLNAANGELTEDGPAAKGILEVANTLPAELLDLSLTEGGVGLDTRAVESLVRMREALPEERGFATLSELFDQPGDYLANSAKGKLLSYAAATGMIYDDPRLMKVALVPTEPEGVAFDGWMQDLLNLGYRDFDPSYSDGTTFSFEIPASPHAAQFDSAEKVARYVWAKFYGDYVNSVSDQSDGQEPNTPFPCGTWADGGVTMGGDADRYSISGFGDGGGNTCYGDAYPGWWTYSMTIDYDAETRAGTIYFEATEE